MGLEEWDSGLGLITAVNGLAHPPGEPSDETIRADVACVADWFCGGGSHGSVLQAQLERFATSTSLRYNTTTRDLQPIALPTTIGAVVTPITTVSQTPISLERPIPALFFLIFFFFFLSFSFLLIPFSSFSFLPPFPWSAHILNKKVAVPDQSP